MFVLDENPAASWKGAIMRRDEALKSGLATPNLFSWCPSNPPPRFKGFSLAAIRVLSNVLPNCGRHAKNLRRRGWWAKARAKGEAQVGSCLMLGTPKSEKSGQSLTSARNSGKEQPNSVKAEVGLSRLNRSESRERGKKKI